MTQINTYKELLDLLGKLAQESATYRKLALFFEKYYMDLSFMTANDVAKKANVSQGSVSRFCKALGFRGYSEFSKNLHNVFRSGITGPERLMRNRVGGPGKHAEIIDAQAADMEKLKEVTESEEYRKMVSFIRESPRFYFMSARYTATILPYAQYMLNRMRDNVYTAVPGTNEWSNLYLKDPKKNGILVFSFPRYPNELVDKVRELHELGFCYQLVTDSRFCPLAQDAENMVILPVGAFSLFDIYAVPLTYLNLLMNDVANGLPGIGERVSAIEEHEKARHIYYEYR